MNEEKERIEKMLTEGRITKEEADGLLAALDKSEKRDEVSSPAQKVERPRFSVMALAGVFSVPAALIAMFVAAQIGMAVDSMPEADNIGQALMLSILLLGFFLSIVALIRIRQNPDRLRGRGYAIAGIIAPVAIVLACLLVVIAPSEPAPSGSGPPPPPEVESAEPGNGQRVVEPPPTPEGDRNK